MTHARSCCCGEPSFECDGVPAIPAGCYLVTITGLSGATCEAGITSPIGTARIASFSVPVSIVIESDGVNTPESSYVIPCSVREEQENRFEEYIGAFNHCEALITVEFTCFRFGPFGTPREWAFRVYGSLTNPCSSEGEVVFRGFNAAFYTPTGSGLGWTRIGGTSPNALSNDAICTFCGTGGSASVVRLPSCEPDPMIVKAWDCSNTSSIAVDLETRPDETYTGCRLDGVLYVPGSELTTDAPDDVEWVRESCPDPEYPTLVRCDGLGAEIAYDPALRPAGMQTAIYQGEQYVDTGSSEPLDPVSVVWTPNECPSILGELYAACGSSGLPSLIRIPNPPASDFIRFGRLGGEYTIGSKICRDLWIGSYERIADDGTPAPTYSGHYLIRSVCEDPILIQKQAVCRIRPDQPGDGPRPRPESPARGHERPTYPIPDDFDPVAHGRELRQGGGCGCSPPPIVDEM